MNDLQDTKDFQTLCAFLDYRFISEKEAVSASLRANITYHKCFLHYAMQRNVLNVDTMSLMSFIKFLKDFDILSLCSPPLMEQDAEVYYISCLKGQSGTHHGISFCGWVSATVALLERILNIQVKVS